MTPVGISGLISDMCPFILSNMLEGIPYSTRVSLCFYREGHQPVGHAPSTLSAWGQGVNPSLGLSGAGGLPKAPLLTSSKGFAEHGGRSRLRDLLACSFPSKCFKRQRLGIKKELLCGGILRRLCKFLHLRAECLSRLSPDCPKQLVASRSGERSHAHIALALQEHLGNVSLSLEGINGSAEQEPSVAVSPEALPWVLGWFLKLEGRHAGVK